MKEANLISIINAFNQLDNDLCKSYLNYFNIKIRDSELKDLEILVNHLKSHCKDPKVFDKYFVGYSIPQIGAEFDLLRIDNETVVNIEIKRKSSAEEIEKQLLKNRYYLKFFGKRVYSFTYISEERKLYYINKSETLSIIEIRHLIQLLSKQDVKDNVNLDIYFQPSNYLVSPFNSTQEFVKKEYFLTKHQEVFKRKIISLVISEDISFLSIKGKAGTGKTLLIYDIANELNPTLNVLIVHCGYLNYGHKILRDNYGWNIIQAKDIYATDLSKFHLVIIDEAQRIKLSQLNHIIDETKKATNNCIFSYDGQQTLSSIEIENNIEREIEKIETFPCFELTNKIRTNKEIATFIKCLFEGSKVLETIKFPNVTLSYFDNILEAKSFLSNLRNENWKVINFTSSVAGPLFYDGYMLENEENAHQIIGQEFDNVVGVIDKYFLLNDGKLAIVDYYKKSYYDPLKMFFQIISRTRNKLHLVIINNNKILERCLDILKQK